jgi:hypothetical protein
MSRMDEPENVFFCNAHPWMQTMVPPDNVRSWLVARVAIVAIFFQIILKLMYCLEGSLLWQNKIGRGLFFAKKTVIAERQFFFSKTL